MKLKNNLAIMAALQGLTLGQVAEKAGINRQNLSIIKRRGSCSPMTAVKIAAALGVDVTEIIQEEE